MLRFKYLFIFILVKFNFGYSQNQSLADSFLIEYNKVDSRDSLTFPLLIGVIANHTNQDSILFYSNQLVTKASVDSSYLWLYRGYLNIGHANRMKGNLEEALHAYFFALKFANKIKYKPGVAAGYTAIGDSYASGQNEKNALYYYNLGIVKFRETNDSINLAVNLLNTGDLYLTNHKLDSALLYFIESGKIFDLKNYKIGQAYNLGNIGLVYAEQGKYKLAEGNITRAAEILLELKDYYPIAVYNASMADIYKDRGDMERALYYATQSYDLAKTDGLKEQIRDASEKLSELYEFTQNYKKAYEYQEEYLVYRDSINSEETIREMADLRTEYEVAQKQIEVDLLNHEKKISRLIRAGLLGGLVVIAGLAFLYFIRNREKRMVNKLLTEQKQQLQAQRNELEVLNSTKDRFFSIISHDLRGPVNSFKGLTSIMKMSLDSKNYQELPKMTEMLNKASSQLSFLLDNLLAWALNQQGEFPYHPKDVNLLALVGDVTNSLTSGASEKNINISLNINDSLRLFVDINSITTVIRNIVNNALKFTPIGGSIDIDATNETDKRAVIKISDTGVGIPAEKLKSLFTLNESNSSPGTEGEKGLGLGLRLAYEFTKMNQGDISVQSKEGQGTTFIIKLPIQTS